MRVKYEDFLGAGRMPGYDDTAVDGLEIKCQNEEGEAENIKRVTGTCEGNCDTIGAWKPWTPYYKQFFVARVKARYGTGEGDETGLNGMKVRMCDWTMGEEGAGVEPLECGN